MDRNLSDGSQLLVKWIIIIIIIASFSRQR